MPAPLAPAVTATMKTFGHPGALVADYHWWSVLLRPKQPTLGSLVLAAKVETTAFSALPPEAFAELAGITADIEGALKQFCAYQKINYLMLMMADPEPHFHVLPRYEESREFKGVEVRDAGWPGPPALGEALALDAGQKRAIIERLRALWPTPERAAAGDDA